MCGNVLVVKDGKGSGELCLVMSERAFKGYTDQHRKILEDNYRIIVNDIQTIERVGGGVS